MRPPEPISRMGGRRPAPWLHVAVHTMVALCASLWVIGGIGGMRAGAATPHTTAAHHAQAGASAGLTTGQKGVTVHGRKEGLLAVALSVLGVIVVVVFIVGLASRAVRRRSRDGPSVTDGAWSDRWRRPFG